MPGTNLTGNPPGIIYYQGGPLMGWLSPGNGGLTVASKSSTWAADASWVQQKLQGPKNVQVASSSGPCLCSVGNWVYCFFLPSNAAHGWTIQYNVIDKQGLSNNWTANSNRSVYWNQYYTVAASSGGIAFQGVVATVRNYQLSTREVMRLGGR